MSVVSTKVKCKCISKKESSNYSKENPINTEIELHVGYDQSNIYYQQSGGTALKLCTVNQQAADMFKIGEDYDIVISPTVVEA